MVCLQSPSVVDLLILLLALQNFEYQLFWFCVKFEQFSYFVYGLYDAFLAEQCDPKYSIFKELQVATHISALT